MDISKLSGRERQALREWVKTQLAQQSFYEFVLQAWHVVEPENPFRDNWHIRAMCEHLQAVAEGRAGDTIANVPPGTMKSLLACVFWPAWIWTWRPAARFMFASYDDALSKRDSVRCRTIIASEWYQARWPMEFQDDQNEKDLFGNERGGWRMSTTVGGRATGHHPHYIVVDDPHNVRKAESATQRQAVIDWWDGTMANRGVLLGVKRVLIMQRLHANDLSGHLLAKGGWEHICLPMRFEKGRMKPTSLGWCDPRTTDGELLWLDVYTDKVVCQMESSMGAYHSAGQLQQRPTPRGGGMFKRDWFPIIKFYPHCDIIVRYWDKAGTEGGDGARSAGVLMGKQRLNGKFIILDVRKGRWGAAERESEIQLTAKLDHQRYKNVTTWVEQEPGSGGKESAEATIKRNAGYTFFADRVTGSKETRAEPLAAQASILQVELLEGDWNEDFLNEVEMFPMGKAKDQVDGASGAFNKLAQPSSGAVARVFTGSGTPRNDGGGLM